MKKRIMCILLSVCMIVSCMTGLGVTAGADTADIIDEDDNGATPDVTDDTEKKETVTVTLNITADPDADSSAKLYVTTDTVIKQEVGVSDSPYVFTLNNGSNFGIETDHLSGVFFTETDSIYNYNSEIDAITGVFWEILENDLELNITIIKPYYLHFDANSETNYFISRADHDEDIDEDDLHFSGSGSYCTKYETFAKEIIIFDSGHDFSGDFSGWSLSKDEFIPVDRSKKVAELATDYEVTLYAWWDDSTAVATTHNVIIDDHSVTGDVSAVDYIYIGTENVTVDKTSAKKGDTVTVTASKESNGAICQYIEYGDSYGYNFNILTNYSNTDTFVVSFTMPDYDVHINATYVLDDIDDTDSDIPDTDSDDTVDDTDVSDKEAAARAAAEAAARAAAAAAAANASSSSSSTAASTSDTASTTTASDTASTATASDTASTAATEKAPAVSTEKKVTTSTLAAAIEAAEDGKTTVAVKAATAAITKKAVNELIKGDVTLELKAENYTVTIDPENVYEPKALDLGMKFYPKATRVNGVSVPEGSFTLIPNQTGRFGAELSLTLPASRFEKMDIKDLKLYRISKKGKVTLVKDGFTVNEDGSVTINMDRHATFTITDGKIK